MKRDAFYVGYLPLPKPLRLFVFVLIPLLLLAGIAVAVVTTSQQNEPGEGVWDLAKTETFNGSLISSPYPMLIPHGGGTPLLLVGEGKTSEPYLSRLFETQPVMANALVSGFPIKRDGKYRLLTSVNEVKGTHKNGATLPRNIEKLGPRTLSGQIIDPKCYFGAMKPGEGKVHKACATLCIAGGIPPMFMVTDEAGERTYYLLVNKAGAGIVGDELDALLPFVADPVRIMGEAERWGELLVLNIDPSSFKRL